MKLHTVSVVTLQKYSYRAFQQKSFVWSWFETAFLEKAPFLTFHNSQSFFPTILFLFSFLCRLFCTTNLLQIHFTRNENIFVKGREFREWENSACRFSVFSRAWFYLWFVALNKFMSLSSLLLIIIKFSIMAWGIMEGMYWKKKYIRRGGLFQAVSILLFHRVCIKSILVF